MITLTELKALGRLRAYIQQQEPFLVEMARKEGLTWEEIGKALGVSRQAVWEKYHDKVD